MASNTSQSIQIEHKKDSFYIINIENKGPKIALKMYKHRRVEKDDYFQNYSTQKMDVNKR